MIGEVSPVHVTGSVRFFSFPAIMASRRSWTWPQLEVTRVVSFWTQAGWHEDPVAVRTSERTARATRLRCAILIVGFSTSQGGVALADLARVNSGQHSLPIHCPHLPRGCTE